MGAHTFDTTAADFDRDVIEASQRVPVLVDFWAPWCGPCRALTPILDKLVAEYAGRFVLAKLNTDEHPDIAARYGVRGIPNVKAFVDGRLVAEFTGAQPESSVRRFIDSLMPSPSELLRQAALAELAESRSDSAESKLREAIALDDQNDAARIDLAEVLFARGDLDTADAMLTAIPEHRRDERSQALASRIALERKRASLPDATALAARVAAAPEDLEGRAVYAERLAADSRYREALDELLEIVRRDRGERREEARKRIVDLFGLAAGEPDLVSDYRRKLASALY